MSELVRYSCVRAAVQYPACARARGDVCCDRAVLRAVRSSQTVYKACMLCTCFACCDRSCPIWPVLCVVCADNACCVCCVWPQELSNLAWAVPCLLGRDAPTHSQGHTSPPLATSAVLQQWLVAVECELTQRLQAASVHGSADVSLQSDSVHTASLAQADTQHLHGGAVQGSTCAYVQTDTAGLVQRGTGASVLTGTVSTTGAEAQLRPQAVACILRCLALLDHSPLAALYDALYSVVTADGSQHSMGALAARATGAAPDTVTGRTRYVQRRSEEAAWATDMQVRANSGCIAMVPLASACFALFV